MIIELRGKDKYYYMWYFFYLKGGRKYCYMWYFFLSQRREQCTHQVQLYIPIRYINIVDDKNNSIPIMIRQQRLTSHHWWPMLSKSSLIFLKAISYSASSMFSFLSKQKFFYKNIKYQMNRYTNWRGQWEKGVSHFFLSKLSSAFQERGKPVNCNVSCTHDQ